MNARTGTSYQMEDVDCYACGSQAHHPFISAEDDLTGKRGTFTFVTCADCGLRYQRPRVHPERIGDFYDDEYIAHRKRTDWGRLTPLFEWAMDKHDREKLAIVRRYLRLGEDSTVLDVGCGAGTFLQKLRSEFRSRVVGVDFKDLSSSSALRQVEFRCGPFHEQQDLPSDHFDLITMWHFLEHDYEPKKSLETARRLLKSTGRLVIEVPRLDSVSFSLYRERWPGLQAPQHTILFEKRSFIDFVRKAGLEPVEYLPYGAFPAYFYLFSGAAFRFLKGRGLNVERWMAPYFLGQLALAPVLLLEKRLNLAMQTLVCRRA